MTTTHWSIWHPPFMPRSEVRRTVDLGRNPCFSEWYGVENKATRYASHQRGASAIFHYSDTHLVPPMLCEQTKQTTQCYALITHPQVSADLDGRIDAWRIVVCVLQHTLARPGITAEVNVHGFTAMVDVLLSASAAR